MADDKWPDPDAPWIGPRDEALDRVARGLGVPEIVRSDIGDADVNHWSGVPCHVASGGLCLPSVPYYSVDLDVGPWTWPDNYWPRRFHPFPRLDRAARALREARWRARHAWLIIRHGADDYDDDP